MEWIMTVPSEHNAKNERKEEVMCLSFQCLYLSKLVSVFVCFL